MQSTCSSSTSDDDARDVGREVREVGGEDRRRDFHQAESSTAQPLRRRALQHQHEHAVGVVRPTARARRRGRAGATARPAAAARRSRGARTRRTRRPRASRSGRACRRSTRAARPGARPRAALASSARCRSASSAASRGSTRQRASGRRRSTPSPRARRVEQHAVERRRRANGRRRPSATIGTTASSRHRATPRITVRTRAGMQVGGDHEPVVAHAFGRAAGLAARRRRDVEHALARLRVERGDDRLAGLVLGRDPALARARRARRDRRCGAPAARRARASPGSTSIRAPAARPTTSSVVVRVGFTRNVTDGRLVVELERGERVVAPELVDELLHDPIGMRGP